MSSVDKKSCTLCGEVKPLSDFYLRERGRRTSRCRKCIYKVAQEKAKNSPKKPTTESSKISAVLKHFKNKLGINITRNEYEKLYEQSAGVCAICGNPEIGRRLSLDHCHATKNLRGFLCKDCNFGLGMAGDSVEILNAAIKYLNGGK